MHDSQVSDDPARTASLDARIRSTWTEEELKALAGPDRAMEIDIEDAAALLGGLDEEWATLEPH